MRAILAPRTKLLPGLGSRLGAHPRLASLTLRVLRRAPGRLLHGAVYRNVTRPLVQRMDARLVVPVAGGSRMIVETSDVPGRLLACSGVWEPHVTAAFRYLLSPGDVCVDAGAHIGYFSLLASKLVGPFGRVYALEPEEKTYCALCANLELNAAHNVLALPVAAGARDGRELLYPAPTGNSGSAALRRRWGTFDPENEASKPRAVSVSSISSILDPAELSRLRLVKIDVEGYELEVLHGLAEVFDAGYRPALVVEVHGDAAPAVGAWAAESRRTHGLFTYRLVAGRSSDRSVPDTAPVEPIHDTELRSLESKFFELLLSPLPLIDDGASAARSAVLGAG